MSCFSPTRGALLPSSFLRPFAFKVSALCRHSLPWPCDFIPSELGLSKCSKWYTACLNGMSRYLPGGLVLVSLLSATSPPKSLCSQIPQRVGSADPIFLRAAAGGAWLPISTHGVLLHLLGGHHCLPPRDVRGGDTPSRFFLQHSGGKDDYQPRGGEQQAEPRLYPSWPPTLWGGKRAVLWLHLLGFDGFGATCNAASCRQAERGYPSSARAMVAPCAGPPHSWRPLRRRPHCSNATQGGRTRHRTPWGWRSRSWMVLSSLLHEDGSEDLFACTEVAAVAGEPPVQRWPHWWQAIGAEVVASAGEAARCGGGCLRWRAARCGGGRCRQC
jgi:hypothetical protein